MLCSFHNAVAISLLEKVVKFIPVKSRKLCLRGWKHLGILILVISRSSVLSSSQVFLDLERHGHWTVMKGETLEVSHTHVERH